MKLSARNIYQGRVIDYKVGEVMARVTVDIGNGKTITSTISLAAFKDLDIHKGDTLSAIIKASSVILGKDQ